MYGLYSTLLYHFLDQPTNWRPSPNCCFFCLFQYFEGKEYQTESKRNETFGESDFWNKRDPGDLEWTSRKKRGGHEAGRRAPTLVGPSQLHRPTSSSYIYPHTPKKIQGYHEILFPPTQPFVAKISHLGAFSGAPPEGASITEGLYINSMAPPTMCE